MSCPTSETSPPVVLDRQQIASYLACFAPASEGLFSRTIAPINPRGSGGSGGRGVLSLEVDRETVVPGSVLNIQYQTKTGTLLGTVDIYLAVRLPTGQLLYVTSAGIGPGIGPLRSNVAIADETTALVTVEVPADLPFGTYTLHMALIHAGADPTDFANLASGVSQVDVVNAPLSAAQQALLQSRGNPDFLAVFWFDQALQKRESWLYHSGTPTRYGFLDGVLDSEEVVSDPSPGPGPKLDPGLFTPQTTLDDLVAVFGPPASVTPVEDAPGHELVTYTSGLVVILRDGRLSSALTITQ